MGVKRRRAGHPVEVILAIEVETTHGVTNFPRVADDTGEVAKKLGMIHPERALGVR